MNIQLKIKANVDNQKALRIAQRVLFKSMEKMHELASRKAPVDTGDLRNSIKLRPPTPKSNKYILHDGVKYGKYQEFGTIFIPAKPFFRSSLAEVKNIWVKRFWERELSK